MPNGNDANAKQPGNGGSPGNGTGDGDGVTGDGHGVNSNGPGGGTVDSSGGGPSAPGSMKAPSGFCSSKSDQENNTVKTFYSAEYKATYKCRCGGGEGVTCRLVK